MQTKILSTAPLMLVFYSLMKDDMLNTAIEYNSNENVFELQEIKIKE